MCLGHCDKWMTLIPTPSISIVIAGNFEKSCATSTKTAQTTRFVGWPQMESDSSDKRAKKIAYNLFDFWLHVAFFDSFDRFLSLHRCVSFKWLFILTVFFLCRACEPLCLSSIHCCYPATINCLHVLLHTLTLFHWILRIIYEL